MTSKEIRELSAGEIEIKLRDLSNELVLLRLKKSSGQVEKTHLLRAYRKDIARLETILKQKKATQAA